MAPQDFDSPTDDASQFGLGRFERHIAFETLRQRLFPGTKGEVSIGRFRLDERLGSGGMGSVYLAFDPRLERRVAIKVLHDSRSTAATTRLLREAKALAQLSHPNVVSVYEVGIVDERVFLVMEYVPGITLARWCEEHPPSDRRRFARLLELAKACARGLSAAHAAGLVHRDFKPANVLVGDDGRPRIVDFGVAMPMDIRPTRTSGADVTSLDEDDDDELRLATVRGPVAGTPGYMSPEHLDGQANALSDQFSFCVSIFEAAYGIHPFGGRSIAELTAAVITGRIRRPDSARGVPRWMEAVLRKGLSADPEQRFSSMAALVDALDAPARRRRVAMVSMAAVGCLGLVAAAATPSASERACERERAALDEAWGPEHRQTVEQALHRSGLRYASFSWQRIEPALDEYAQRWTEIHAAACVARQDGRDPLASQRLGCMENARHELTFVTEQLASGHPDALRHATDLVATLPDLERCRGDDPPGPNASAALRPHTWELLRRLSEGVVLAHAGRYPEARARLLEVREEARELGHGMFEARAGSVLATLAQSQGRYEDAATFAQETLDVAEREGLTGAAFDAWLQLAAASRSLDKLDRASFQIDRARTLLGRPGLPDRAEADLDYSLGSLLASAGQRAEALAALERAEAGYRALPRTEGRVADLHSDMARVLLEMGRPEQALEFATTATSLQIANEGPDHPRLALILAAQAEVFAILGRFEDALAARHRAWELVRDPSGSARVRIELGIMVANDLALLRRFDEAKDALAVVRNELRGFDDEPQVRAMVDMVEGNIALDRGDPADAVTHYERAWNEIAALPRGSSNRLALQGNLAYAAAQAGSTEAAERWTRLLEDEVAGLPPSSPFPLLAALTRADVERLGGRPQASIEHYHRALELMDGLEAPAEKHVRAHFGLAQATWADDPTQARAHAQQAMRALEGEALPLDRERVAAWLAEHPGVAEG